MKNNNEKRKNNPCDYCKKGCLDDEPELKCCDCSKSYVEEWDGFYLACAVSQGKRCDYLNIKKCYEYEKQKD